MRLKLTGLLVLLISTANLVTAQTSDITLSFSGSNEILVNDLHLTNQTSTDELKEALGEPSKSEENPGSETSYFYESHGLVFNTIEGKVRGIGVNFNWDGDDKFPETPFSGTLTIGETEITTETGSEMIASIETVEFTCPIPLMCATADRNAPVRCMAGFSDDKLSQVVFLFK